MTTRADTIRGDAFFPPDPCTRCGTEMHYQPHGADGVCRSPAVTVQDVPAPELDFSAMASEPTRDE